jgi:hypothetical protein
LRVVLEVAEVWLWIDDKFWIYRLVGRDYAPQTRSSAIPNIDLDTIAKIVTLTKGYKQTEAVRAYRKTLRRQRSPDDILPDISLLLRVRREHVGDAQREAARRRDVQELVRAVRIRAGP